MTNTGSYSKRKNLSFLISICNCMFKSLTNLMITLYLMIIWSEYFWLSFINFMNYPKLFQVLYLCPFKGLLFGVFAFTLEKTGKYLTSVNKSRCSSFSQYSYTHQNSFKPNIHWFPFYQTFGLIYFNNSHIWHEVSC